MCLWVDKEEKASSTAFRFLAQEPVFKWDMEFSLCFGLINIGIIAVGVLRDVSLFFQSLVI